MMVILDIYTKHIKVKYKSTLLSKATFLVVMTNILTVVLPFVIAYKTGELWQKSNSFYEQPTVQYNGDYLFVATTNTLIQPLVVCSSFTFYKKHLDQSDMCSNLKVRQNDKDHDGKIDTINFILTAELTNEKKLSSINLVLPLKYKIKTVCPFEIQSAIIYQEYSQFLLQATEIVAHGDLTLKQSHHIKCSKRGINQWLNSPVIEDDGYTTDNFNLENILEAYFKRNVSTYLSNTFTIFKTTKKSQRLTIDLNVNYPEHNIYYKPRFWQIIKHAWIQYMAIYIIISWLFLKIKQYIFKNNLVLFYKEQPIKKVT